MGGTVVLPRKYTNKGRRLNALEGLGQKLSGAYVQGLMFKKKQEAQQKQVMQKLLQQVALKELTSRLKNSQEREAIASIEAEPDTKKKELMKRDFQNIFGRPYHGTAAEEQQSAIDLLGKKEQTKLDIKTSPTNRQKQAALARELTQAKSDVELSPETIQKKANLSGKRAGQVSQAKSDTAYSNRYQDAETAATKKAAMTAAEIGTKFELKDDLAQIKETLNRFDNEAISKSTQLQALKTAVDWLDVGYQHSKDPRMTEAFKNLARAILKLGKIEGKIDMPSKEQNMLYDLFDKLFNRPTVEYPVLDFDQKEESPLLNNNPAIPKPNGFTSIKDKFTK